MEFLWASLVDLREEDKDGVLLRRLKAKDPQAVADLYDLYGRILYVVILRIVNNPGVAEDLVQETYLRAWHRASYLKEDYPSVGPWLLSIARNGALDYLKSSHARFSAQLPTVEVGFAPVTVEDDLVHADRARLLAQALHSLAPQHRNVLELAYFQGLSQTAIAEHLKQPLGTVKSWTRIALQKLRHELERSHVKVC